MTSLVQQISDLERVSELHLKRHTPTQIARATGLSTAQVKRLIDQYQEAIATRVMDDPDFLDRLQENTLEALAQQDLLIKEAWETYESAKDLEMMNQQINLLKVMNDLQEKRNKLLQLMGAKVDSGMTARMQRAEQVNQKVSEVIKDVISGCDRCRTEAQVKLAEAFAIMDKAEEVIDLEPEEEIEEAEVVTEQTDDEREAMMNDVFGDKY